MTEPTYETRKIWIKGRRGCITCVTVTIYPNSIAASGECDQITVTQFREALRKEFPRHIFCLSDQMKWDEDYICAYADRWTDDGADNDEARV